MSAPPWEERLERLFFAVAELDATVSRVDSELMRYALRRGATVAEGGTIADLRRDLRAARDAIVERYA